MEIKEEKFIFKPELKNLMITGVVVGALCTIFGFVTESQRAWVNYLINFYYFVSLGLSGAVIVAIASLTNASWAAPFKRIPEAFTKFLPIGFLLGLGLIVGIHSIYEWSHADIVAKDELLQLKQAFLNTKFYIVRLFIFFGVWIFTTKMLTKLSYKQDKKLNDSITGQIVKWSAIFLVTFGFSYSLASFDWIMSVKPHWFSTIFGVYTFSGMFVNGFAVITFTLIWLQERGYLADIITEDIYHDLGKFLFGFATFWAYIWLSQFLLIWYSNIPEETMYYTTRYHHTWDWLFIFNFAINWFIPFLALMTRKSKRSKFVLKRVAVLLIIGHWLDIYLMVAPDVYEHAHITNPSIGLIEIGMSIGFGSLFFIVVANALSKQSLVAVNDPYIEEGIHLHQ